MPSSRALPLLAALLILPSSASAATTRLVSKAGADTGDCTVTPCLTINYALGKASPLGDETISIGPGVFAEHIDTIKIVTLKGAGAGTLDAADPATTTTIDGTAGVAETVRLHDGGGVSALRILNDGSPGIELGAEF